VLKVVISIALAAVAGSCAANHLDTPPTPGATTTSPVIQIHHWPMPNEVGAGLQDAQDAIQKLTGDEIFFTSSHDVSGKGRHQILDRDWKVCSQNIAAGTQIQPGVKIDFGVVKLAESCP
jgi:hypothetical protein